MPYLQTYALPILRRTQTNRTNHSETQTNHTCRYRRVQTK